MTNDGFDGSPSLATLSLFVALVTVVPFQGRGGQDDLGVAYRFWPFVAPVTGGGLDGLAPAVAAVCQDIRQGLAVMQVVAVAGHADDDAGFRGGGNGNFVAALVPFMAFAFAFAFADAASIGFMQRVGLVLVLLLPTQDAPVKQEAFPVAAKQAGLGQTPAQFTGRRMGDGTQSF